MRLTVEDPEAREYKVIDADTGEDIPLCVEADDEAGTYVQYATLPGSNEIECDSDGNPVLLEKRGNIRLVRVE